MCPAVEIFSFSTLLCFTLGPGLHETYLIYRTAKRKADFVRQQPPSRDYWGFPWRVMGPILGDPGGVSRVGRKDGGRINCRIPCHLFACHWIRIASIVLCFVLQRTPTNENNGGTEWQGIQQLLQSFQVRVKEPLGTDSHQTISKNSSGCRVLIGHKKCFVLLCPIGKQFLLGSFREFVHDGYCLATLAQFVHQACAYKGNFYFLLS